MESERIQGYLREGLAAPVARLELPEPREGKGTDPGLVQVGSDGESPVGFLVKFPVESL